MSVDVAIREAAAAYLGWGYRSPAIPARVAESGPWVPDSVVRRYGESTPAATDCCTFVAGVLSRACPGKWPADAWAQMMILDAGRPWSTVECPIGAGVAVAAAEPEPGRWYVAQGWSGLRLGRVEQGATGHTWLQWGADRILEASSRAGKVTWTERAWADQRRRYDEVRLAHLVIR